MNIRPLFVSITCVALLAACQDGGPTPPATPTMQSVAGSYAALEGEAGSNSYGAISFTTTLDGKTTDWLAQGAVIQISLALDGSTTGHILVPGVYGDGSDFDEDLAGSWSLDGSTATLSHSADTFLRDMPFTVEDDQIIGDRAFGDDARIRVVLEKR